MRSPQATYNSIKKKKTSLLVLKRQISEKKNLRIYEEADLKVMNKTDKRRTRSLCLIRVLRQRGTRSACLIRVLRQRGTRSPCLIRVPRSGELEDRGTRSGELEAENSTFTHLNFTGTTKNSTSTFKTQKQKEP